MCKTLSKNAILMKQGEVKRFSNCIVHIEE